MIYDWPNPCQPRKQEETTSPLFGSNPTVLTEHYSSRGQYLKHLQYFAYMTHSQMFQKVESDLPAKI